MLISRNHWDYPDKINRKLFESFYPILYRILFQHSNLLYIVLLHQCEHHETNLCLTNFSCEPANLKLHKFCKILTKFVCRTFCKQISKRNILNEYEYEAHREAWYLCNLRCRWQNMFSLFVSGVEKRFPPFWPPATKLV